MRAHFQFCDSFKVLIWEEWIQNLALRRVYYLEYNHYERRKAEIEYMENLKDPEDVNTTQRPVYVVHPEYRDTVPNIGLYSVLFRLPFITPDDDATCASKSDVGRQLQLAIDFFDKVVPNQPGYSSSIAALTILPDVQRLSMAWKKWFRCASKVRRLKFIRKRLAELRKNEDLMTFSNGGDNTHTNGVSGGHSQNGDNSDWADLERDVLGEGIDDSFAKRYASAESSISAVINAAALNVQQESNMEMFLEDDEHEQMAVYYREYARSSATCGPNGCDEYAIMNSDIPTLEDLEQEAAEEVSVAIDQLHEARDDIRAEEPVPEHYQGPDVMSDMMMSEMVSIGSSSNRNVVFAEPTTPENDGEEPTDLWEQCEALIGAEQYMVIRQGKAVKRKMNTGGWYNPLKRSFDRKDLNVQDYVPSGFFKKITRRESYAVVTFTSRQAAIAARQCLSDGSGLDGWRQVDSIPIPPLADAVPWNICDCRGCCRPVTLTLPSQERRFRFKM